jgi:L-fuconolactonase
MLAIDSHHHLWNPFVGDFSWMTKAHAPINRQFTQDDLAPLLVEAKVSHTVLVQTWSSLEETEEFLNVAGATEFIAGVVGWMDLTEDVHGQIDRLMKHPDVSYLKAVRHQVHDEDDANWLMRPDVQQGLQVLEINGLAYDLLIRPREIPAAIACVMARPDMKFIVDHIAKPNIRDGWDVDWADQIAQLAKHRSHVWIKLSGMVTEADWAHWTPEDIRPYVAHVISLFGSDRVMVGSDWPVCTLASNYARTMDLVRECIADLPETDQSNILRDNAINVYDLKL